MSCSPRSPWFIDTELFYGYYISSAVNVTGVAYEMKYAYLTTCADYYLLTLIILATVLSNSYKNSFVQTLGEYETSYANRLFQA